MCGIAGILNLSRPLTDQVPLVKRMLGRIEYRGPDESGIYTGNHVCLGSVRLSIIDISSGRQPISDKDQTHWIVFNGEIFNYIELRNDLIKKGYTFRTFSDTEVLLLLYMHYGTECLNLLNGQFAFAIWNCQKKELFLARDRAGIRPLFYTFLNGTFLFGSEIKTLFEVPGVKAGFNPAALAQVFTFWTTVSPDTVFENIKELQPGHYMKVSEAGVTVQPFWKLTFPGDRNGYFSGSVEEAGEELDRLLTDAVKIRLRADVPVAAYLSGGLDSSATTYYIKKISPENLQTFSIGFEDSEFDETPFQQQVSGFLDTRHVPFRCSNEDIGNYFPQIVWHSEVPVLRTAPVPMFCLSKEVRKQNIKVVITGEGADEMLAGYDIFKEALIREFWSRQPDSKYRPLLLSRLYPYMAQFRGKNRLMFKFFYGFKLDDTASPFYSHLLRWHNTSSLLNYFSPEIKNSLNGYDPSTAVNGILPVNFDKWDILGKSQWLESVLFMPGYLLSSQGDRVAMANSVEGRYPFLDYRIMEFCAKLPPHFKMKGLNEKYLLKKIMKNRIPENVIKRPKQAYRAPVYQSFFPGSKTSLVKELLSEERIREAGLFDFEKISKLTDNIKSHQQTTEIENMSVTAILSAQILHSQYISKKEFRPEGKELKNCKVVYDKNCTF